MCIEGLDTLRKGRDFPPEGGSRGGKSRGRERWRIYTTSGWFLVVCDECGHHDIRSYSMKAVHTAYMEKCPCRVN